MLKANLNSNRYYGCFLIIAALFYFEPLLSQEVFKSEVNLKVDGAAYIQFCSNNNKCYIVKKPNNINRVDSIKFLENDKNTYSYFVDKKTLIDFDGMKLGTLLIKEKLFQTEKQILINSDSTIVNIEKLKNSRNWIFKVENDTIIKFHYDFDKKSKTHFIEGSFNSKNDYANIAIQIWLVDFYRSRIDKNNSDYVNGFLNGLLMGLF